LAWKDLFEPAIRLCEEGFKVPRALAAALRLRESRIKADKGLSQIFINPMTNSVYKENDTVRHPNYARTLRNISEHGAEIIYNGIYTGIIVSEINQNGLRFCNFFKNYLN
jgi:gamma-glutamyltranspeptidase/glutathione hydrolase/leukotriene-C4 hydrolase